MNPLPLNEHFAAWLPHLSLPVEETQLSFLRLAEDYTVLEMEEEEGWYDGPSGPFTKTVAVRVRAFGREWTHARDEWIDRGRGIRMRFFVPAAV